MYPDISWKDQSVPFWIYKSCFAIFSHNFEMRKVSGGASSEKPERNGGDFDVIFQSKGIPN